MSNRLIIKDFGPVKEADIELKPFLVLIGGQGTGKSTIVKVLTIFQDMLFYMRVLKKEDPFIAFREFGISEYFCENTYISFRLDKIAVEYRDKEFHWTSTELPDHEQAYQRFSTQLGKSTKALLEPIIGKHEITPEIIRKYGDLIRPNSRMAPLYPCGTQPDRKPVTCPGQHTGRRRPPTENPAGIHEPFREGKTGVPDLSR